ncbi:Carboxylic acid transporter [Cladophialophora chaetospira]|uniref:Carboxylic acid transporter n=1 Tax=Cladophialophora chaetospira TaxID=386627 RepID=A0AA39CIU6_9EURO|nr:Carboxylic acid transporter [Cladophialophora chaetospira]
MDDLDAEKGDGARVEQRSPSPEERQDDLKMSVGQYLSTRISTLKPTFTIPPNPFKLLGMLTRKNWLFFGVAMAGWTWDAFDFFTVSLTVTQLAAQFDKSNTDITWGITLVLMVRSVGAITFGLASDRYGRKWPFIVNNVLFIVFELATGFCNTYSQFLACRALFGIAMGGMYGNAVATALEDCPPPARGIVSGILQMGYILGYLLATAFARALVDTTSHGWRPLFWFGAAIPVLIILYRLCLPETDAYINRQKVRKSSERTMTLFFREIKFSLQSHWLVFVYMVLLTAGMNFQTHGTQDLYPLMLKSQFGFTANGVTITNVVANLGGFTGGITFGYLSEIFGRRATLMFTFIFAAALLYPYTFVTSRKTAAPGFFEQFFIEGALGIIPIHLLELSPGSLRTFTVGTAYQLGNLASSASSTIEAKIGERFPLPPTKTGLKRYNYGKVICIFAAACLAYNIVIVLIGPERKGVSLKVEDDVQMKKAVGEDHLEQIIEGETNGHRGHEEK